MLKKKTYAFAATRATDPQSPISKLPLASVDEFANEITIKLSVIAIPTDPHWRSGFLPILSITRIVETHAPILTAPLIIFINNASDSEKPTACHKTAP